jgi:uncharacterized membrane protein/gas vesicle protein
MERQMTETGLDLGSLDLGKILAGAAAGALLMYMLDPDRGSARRAQAADKITGLGRQTGATLSNTWEKVGSRLSHAAEDVSERISDTAQAARPEAAAAARSMSAAVSDSMQRMGSRASETISHSVDQLSDAASSAGGRMRRAVQGMGGDWVPAARSSAVLGGGVLGLYGLLRRSPLGWAIGLAGVALLARGVLNQPFKSMMRGQALGQTIDLEKSIRIDASPEEVYDMFASYENFPRFMSHVAEVRDTGHRRSHWVVKGPAGSQFEWDSVLTEQSRPHRLAWRSEPGAEIANSGSIQFEPWRDGTRVTVRMSYSPPAGALGHGVATLLGADPKRQMDDDLARMKGFIERGITPRDLSQQGRSESRFLH